MVSEREFKQKLKEEWLSKWIDDLNHENKPNEEFVDQSDLTEKEREEMYELLDTVRFVKRLRNRNGQSFTSENKKKKQHVTGRTIGILLVSCIALLLMIFPVLFSNESRFVNAMEKAINQLDYYEATVLFRVEIDQQTVQSSKTHLIVGESGTFKAMTDVNQRLITRVSPGDELVYTFFDDRDKYVEISYLGSEGEEFYQEMFLMNPLIEELKEIEEIEEVRKEWINGRETTLYHFRYYSDGPYHQVWVDEKTDLPIQMVQQYENGDRITRSIVDLNLELMMASGDIFNVELDENTEIHYTSIEAEERMDENAD